MSNVVLDSSALVALFRREPGAERVAAQLPGALMSTVNFAEVMTKLHDYGAPIEVIVSEAETIGLTLVDYSKELAVDTASLRAVTRAYGLSLGDRACLALSQQRGLPAMTADAAWAKMPGFDIELIRRKAT